MGHQNVVSTQTIVDVASSGVQTETAQNDSIDVFTQTIVQSTVIAPTQTNETTLSAGSSASLSSLNQNEISKKNVQTDGNILSCEYCGYATKHSGHFNVHKSEGCRSASVDKNMNCPICCKSYTYNNLRAHLRQYLKESSKAQNGHQYYKPEDHQQLLLRIKKEKQELFK